MSGININDTDRFNDIISYLDESKTTVTNYNDDLNKIGQGLSGSVKSVYNTSSSSVKEMINNLLTKIDSAKSHINTSLGVYYSVGDELKNKLNDIYDSIFNDEDYESKLVYVASGESKKLSYEEFIELVNNSEEYFKKQREKVYNEFLANMVVAGPTMIKKLGTNIYNAVVENTYFFITDYKPGSDRYKKDLANFKLKFGKTILNQYENLDFIPDAYKKTGEYNRALLALSFDDKDYHDKYDMILKTFNAIDERTKNKGYEIGQTMSNVYSFYQAKDILTNFPPNATPKELLDYYSKAINSLKEDFDIAKHRDRGIVIPDYTYEPDENAWYDAIKNTEAFKKLKNYLPNDKNEIFNMTNNMEFLSAIYQYDGMDSLQTIYSKYYSDCIGKDAPKEYLVQSNLDEVVRYSTMNTILGTFSQPLMDTKDKLRSVDNSEASSLLLLAKDLDTSDITDETYQNRLKEYNGKWTNYCDGNDYTKYLEDWQLKSFVKILEHDKDLANKLFNNSEGADRGILNEKIMEGYAFDVAKDRVKLMAMDNQDGIAADEYLRSILFSAAYGFGYGITDFTTGLVDIFASDGKMDKRQLEKNNIMSLLASDYSLEANYYNKDAKTMEMFSTDYPDEYVNTIKLKNFTREDIEDFINDCKNNKVPRYELEYYMGNISYEEFIKYQNVANLSQEDLAFYANLNNSAVPKWLADKSFKVSNTVGTMAIPTVLSLIASAASPVGATAGTAMKLLSTGATALSYGSLFGSSLGRNVEALKQSGETNNGYIWTNALLTSAFESFGEMALGKILKPTKLTEFLKESTAKNHPFLGAIFNASDNFESYLLRNNCNPKLAKYLSGIVGEVIQENTENIFGHGIDAATSAIFKDQIKLPTLDELISEAWETTWMTALTTPILNGMTDLALSNVIKTIDINGKEVKVSLSDILLFSNEENGSIDYEELSNYLLSKGKMNEEILNDVIEICKIKTIGELNDENSSILQERLNLPISRDFTLDENTVLEYSLSDIDMVADFDFLPPEVSSKLDERIIEEQDNIVINNALRNEYPDMTTYILNNPVLLKKLSTENLIRLGASVKSKSTMGDITSEIRTRFENGESIYATNSLIRTLWGRTWDSNNLFLRNLSTYDPELSDAIIKREAKAYKTLPKNIRNILDSSEKLSAGSKLALASMYMNGEIDENGIELVKSLEGYTNKIKTFNYELLNKDIINDLGVDLVKDLGRYSDLSTKIVSLKKSDSKVYNALVAMINNASLDNSLQNKSNNIENAINFMFDNSTALEGNIDSINLESLQDYINLSTRIGNSFSNSNIIPNFSNNFINDYNSNIDESAQKVIEILKDNAEDPFTALNKEKGVKDLKKLYYNKIFQSTDGEINNLINKYGKNIDYIKANNPDNKYIELLDYMIMVNNIDDPETMINLYQNPNNISFTAEEIAAFDDFMRGEYVDTYLKSFDKTNKKMNSNTHIEEHQGKQVQVVEMDGDFSIFVHSSDTGFTENKKLVNDSFVDTYKMTSNASVHGVSTSFITQDNIGSAPVGKNGVLYGFTNLQNQDVQSMGPADINSHIANYGFSSGANQQYVVADQMSQETLRLYNEVVLNRDTTTPSCVVLLSDASNDVVENSYKAASEWNIPVVKIDVNNIAQTQTNAIKNDIINYRQTGDMNYLKNAIQNYESGTAGFNLNAIQEQDKFSNVHSGVSNYYESLNIENQLLEEAKKLKANNSTKEIDEFIYMIDSIKKTYTYVNQRNNPTAKTQSMINYDNILEVLVGNE